MYSLQHTLQQCMHCSIRQPVERRASSTISLSDAWTDNIQPSAPAHPHLSCVFGSRRGKLALQPWFGRTLDSFSSLGLCGIMLIRQPHDSLGVLPNTGSEVILVSSHELHHALIYCHKAIHLMEWLDLTGEVVQKPSFQTCTEVLKLSRLYVSTQMSELVRLDIHRLFPASLWIEPVIVRRIPSEGVGLLITPVTFYSTLTHTF